MIEIVVFYYLLCVWSMINTVAAFSFKGLALSQPKGGALLFNGLKSSRSASSSSSSSSNKMWSKSSLHFCQRTNTINHEHYNYYHCQNYNYMTTRTNVVMMNSLKNLELEAQTIEDMEDIGAILGIESKKGDVILLDGDLGSGKTCFSRGFIRAKTGFMDLRITSPTYLLSNTYPTHDGDIDIHHMDLYRLSEGEDLSPLNLDYVLDECISLIEWPSRLGANTPDERLEVTISIDKDDLVQDSLMGGEETARILELKPFGKRWEQRILEIQEKGYLDDLIIEYEDDSNC